MGISKIIGLAANRLTGPKPEKKEPSFFSCLLSDPESFRLEAEVVEGELVVKIRRKDISQNPRNLQGL